MSDFPPADLMARVEADPDLIADLPVTVQQAVRARLRERGWRIARDQLGHVFYLRPRPEISDEALAAALDQWKAEQA